MPRHGCSECNATYSRRDKLKEHLQRKHEITVMPKDTLLSAEQLKAREEEEEPNEMECDAVRPSPIATVKTTSSGSVRYLCRDCGSSFKHRDQLKTHLLEQHKYLEVIDHLPMTAQTRMVAEHSTLVVNQKPFACHICESSYRKTDKLTLHLREKHRIVWLRTGKRKGAADYKPFECRLCGRELMYRKTLRTHMRLCHKIRTDPDNENKSLIGEASGLKPQFICPTCGMTCRAAITFDAHLLEHCPLPFKCTLCDKGFSLRRKRVDHELQCLMLHTTSCVSYQCLSCCEVLKQVTELKEHRKKCHPEDEQAMAVSFNCTLCNAKFDEEPHLLKHLNEVHEHLACNFCDKSYRNTTQLKTHYNCVHRQKMSLICTECGKQLSRPDKLIEHMWTHTGFQCFTCKMVLPSRREWKQHREEAHRSKGKKSSLGGIADEEEASNMDGGM